jgi:hypothetical protein
MMNSPIIERFAEESPTSLMVQGLMEHLFAQQELDALFEQQAQAQYTRDLLFSEVVDLMSLVVCGLQPSVNRAYQRKAKELQVSRTAVYDKLNRMEPEVSAALVRYSSEQLSSCIREMDGALPEWIEGRRVRILDGNCLAATDHRLEVLRPYAAKALPGKSLVVLEPALQLATHVFPCLDGHAQERALFSSVLSIVEPGDVWIADRNMGTLKFLFALQQAQADFVIRQHGTPGWEALADLEYRGETTTGQVWEQPIRLHHDGQTLELRRIVVRLNQPTRDGDSDIAILTSLPTTMAGAHAIAELYRNRWSVETLFQIVTENFEGEIQTLGYPPAALFSFCMALVAYNLLATIKAALRAVHGAGKVEAGLSWYYLVEDVQATYRGLSIAIEPDYWQQWRDFSTPQLAQHLLELAAQVNLKTFLKQPRSPKRKKPPLIVDRNHRHLSTQRLLEEKRAKP